MSEFKVSETQYEPEDILEISPAEVEETDLDDLSEERNEAEIVVEDLPFMAAGEYINLVFLDDGHGLWTSGKRTPLIPELGRSIRENEFNEAVVDLMYQKLKPLGIVPIKVAPTDADTPLADRTNFANKTLKGYQDRYGKNMVRAIYVSIHFDAMSHTWHAAEGQSIFVYPGNIFMNSGRLAAHVAEYLRQGTKQNWRGIREANFHVLRETNMPAILTENGFMSSIWESRLMLNKSFQAEVATEHSKGIAKYFGVTYREETLPTTPPSAGTPATYTIQKGDTFYSIAEKYGLTVDDIKQANPGVDHSNLQIGQVIKLPGSLYTIQKGDTLYSIAEEKSVTLEALLKANPGIDPKSLQIGQVIKIPKASGTTAPKPSPAPAPAPAPAPTRTINGIKIVGDIQITGVRSAAYIVDRPSSSNSRNLGTASVGSKLPISGSVPGWWEVVYKGRRAYVKDDYGRRV